MNRIKKNLVGFIAFVVVGAGLCFFVEACLEHCGKKITLDETLTTTVDNELKHVFFDAIVVHPLHVVVQATISLHCSFFDVVAQNISKNIQRQQVIGKNNLIKSALKDVVYDTNSSHFYFPCRYHVVALREIII
jgi:hypothetical protein